MSDERLKNREKKKMEAIIGLHTEFQIYGEMQMNTRRILSFEWTKSNLSIWRLIICRNSKTSWAFLRKRSISGLGDWDSHLCSLATSSLLIDASLFALD